MRENQLPALASRQAALQSAQRYLQQQLAPSLKLKGRLQIEPESSGVHSLVFRVLEDRQSRFILRGERSRSALTARKTNHDFLRNWGIAVPEVVYIDRCARTKRRYGYRFLLERCIVGRPFPMGRADSGAIEDLARLFARLHQIERGHPGRVARWSVAYRPLKQRLKKRARRWLAGFRRKGFADHRPIAAWFAGLNDSHWSQRPRLCHGDVTADNLILSDEGLWLIDLSEVRFFSASFELARLQLKLFPQGGDNWLCFLDAYRRQAGDSLRKEIDAALPLGLAMALLHSTIHTPNAQVRTRLLERLANFRVG